VYDFGLGFISSRIDLLAAYSENPPPCQGLGTRPRRLSLQGHRGWPLQYSSISKEGPVAIQASVPELPGKDGYQVIGRCLTAASDTSAKPMADDTAFIASAMACTIDLIFFGALEYAYSKLVIDARISAIPVRM